MGEEVVCKKSKEWLRAMSWHRCDRWWRQKAACPFAEAGFEDEFDEAVKRKVGAINLVPGAGIPALAEAKATVAEPVERYHQVIRQTVWKEGEHNITKVVPQTVAEHPGGAAVLDTQRSAVREAVAKVATVSIPTWSWNLGGLIEAHEILNSRGYSRKARAQAAAEIANAKSGVAVAPEAWAAKMAEAASGWHKSIWAVSAAALSLSAVYHAAARMAPSIVEINTIPHIIGTGGSGIAGTGYNINAAAELESILTSGGGQEKFGLPSTGFDPRGTTEAIAAIPDPH